MKYNMLTVIDANAGVNKHRKKLWTCICDCGQATTLGASLVRNGYQKSCGCLRTKLKTNLIHGRSKSRVYSIWCDMHKRVKNPIGNNKCYEGVTIDPSWDDFKQFFADMSDPPIGRSIDRIDGTKGYSKDNCRWASHLEQARNRRCVKQYVLNGESKTLMEWSEQFNIPYNTLYHRMTVKGMSLSYSISWVKNSKPNRRGQMTITFNSETLTMKQWAEKLGISYTALYKRIVTRNLPLEQALVSGAFN